MVKVKTGSYRRATASLDVCKISGAFFAPLGYNLHEEGSSENKPMAGVTDILVLERDAIVKDWVSRLHSEVSPRYSALPLHELFTTISRAADANFAVLAEGDYRKIDAVIEWISGIRASAGFTLSEVQKAFELYRPTVIGVAAPHLSYAEFVAFLDQLNACLSYTIHRFSDYFQDLHEREIRAYAQALEQKVNDRTKELAESEARYRTLVEEIGDGYFVNQKGNIIFANKAFCDMHGYSFEEVLGRPYTDFVAPESRKAVRLRYRKRLSGGPPKEQYAYLRLHKNGTVLPTENKVTIAEYDGEAAVIAICRDITERMEIERRIRESERLAHIGHLTTSLAHEIRNPLSSAKMSIQMLLKNEEITGTDRRRLEILSQEVARLSRITTDMLDFARPVRFDLRKASLPTLINDCLEAIDGRLKEKKIVTEMVFPKTLPAVPLDREKMEQAIINLLLNSAEAVREGGEIGIRVALARMEKALRIDIHDNGHGISDEDLPYIFDPYFSRKAKGTGLGLANAKKIIEAHGGSIEARRRKPAGASFVIVIPIEERGVPSKEARKPRVRG